MPPLMAAHAAETRGAVSAPRRIVGAVAAATATRTVKPAATTSARRIRGPGGPGWSSHRCGAENLTGRGAEEELFVGRPKALEGPKPVTALAKGDGGDPGTPK